jgi:DNA-binding CsgD family transcriptional regulator
VWTPAAGTVLFDRDAERAVLIAALDRALTGRGSVAIIEGAAGMGKTALIGLTTELAVARGLLVLKARGSEIESEVPLITFRGLFEDHLATLTPARRAALLASAAEPLVRAMGPSAGGGVAGGQLHLAAKRMIADLARHGPLVVLVDDLHNADASTLGAIAAMARQLAELPVAMVLTRRPEDCGHDPAALEELAAVADQALTLRPLSVGSSGAVLAALGGEAVDEVVSQRVHEATGGNPFLVVQLARAFAEIGKPVNRAQLNDLIVGVARSLSAVLRVRVGCLGPEAASLARAVAVLGDDASVTEACGVAGLTREVALTAATVLAGAGIFAGDRINCFAHPLVRGAVEADLLAAERTLLEERAVAVLLGSGAEPGRTAVHLLSTEPTGDPRATLALRAAAAAAAGSGVPARAVALLRRALVERPDEPTRGELLDELISAELRAGDHAAAIAHLRTRLGKVAGAAARTRDFRRLSRATLETQGVAATAVVLDEALDGVEGDPLALEAERLWVSVFEADAGRRVQTCRERYATVVGRTLGERAMLAALAVGLALERESSEVVGPLLHRAFGDGALLLDEGPESPLYMLAARVMVACDRALAAEKEMTRAAAVARAQGSSGALAMALAVRGSARLGLGRVSDAEADGLSAFRAGTGSEGVVGGLTRAIALGVVVDARTESGDPGRGLAALVENGFAGDLQTDPQRRALLARARALLAAGRPAEALADARRAGIALGEFAHASIHPDGVICLAQTALGDRPAALRAGEAQLVRAEAWGAPSAVAGALRGLGLAHGDLVGIGMIERAVSLLDESHAELELARCLVALGILRRRAGQRGKALEVLRSGADLAHRLGARSVAQVAREHLVVLGSRPRRLAFTGAEALTASERRAAQLAAAGHTNREIARELYLSVKTVESHLGRGFRKLGISSRRDLANALSPPSH